jgi:small subunit ribosomal protein S3Ae
MAKNTKKKVSRTNVKKKLWCKIIAPKLFGQKELGEAYLSSPEDAVGRVMRINLKDLTGSMKDQKAHISFKIDRVEGSTLRTSVNGYRLTPTSVKRIVRKNINKLDDYFVFKTKNGKEIVLKSLVITFNRTQRSTRNQVRIKLKELLAEEISKSDFETFIGNLVSNRVQMGIKKKLHKIYPIKEVAVRVLCLNEKTLQKEKEKEVAPVKAEKVPAEVPEVKEEVSEKPAEVIEAGAAESA